MLQKTFFRCFVIFISLFFSTSMLYAETVGVFYDSNLAQIKFAAGDIKTALESKAFTVELLPISTLTSSYPNKKVVVSLATDTAVVNSLKQQSVALPIGLGEQAYGLRTTTTPQMSYWVLGGDVNGAMYGGLQLAENITFNGFAATYNNQESPTITKRGIKLNLPFDVKSPTYFSSNNSTASKNAIANVWDFTFWTTWFDEMARMRYNILSVWNNHPFTSMIKLPDYPNVALNNVTGYPNIYNDNDNTGVVIKTMTIDQKIEFWQKVMAYAKDRGFSFYLFNWNLFLSNANGQYGMTDKSAGVTNPATITYMRKCMYELLKTYPNLDGFGVTEGEGMSSVQEDNSLFLANTYGKGMADFAKDYPNRKLNFVHRWHMSDFTLMKQNFTELLSCPNVTFNMSFKYSDAHMYSSATPGLMSASNINALKSNNLKTFFTVRNDDFYYHNWGNPNYAREYINNIPGKNDWFKGFYIGSDGFHQTRTFFSKNSVTQGQLEIQRLWYMNMIWGRLAFNPNTSDDVFKNYMKLKYPEIPTNDLFTAWNKASSGLPKVGEIIFGVLNLDYEWYPENCMDKDGFLTIAKFAAATTRSTSKLCDISNSAANTCNGKTSTFAMADQIEADAMAALALVETTSANANSELGVAINNIKAMSYLTIYYAYKIRGATFSKALNKTIEAQDALGKAYCWWMKYTNLMDANFKGMSCQRVAKFDTWHQHDAAVLKEYTDVGGLGVPNCTSADPQVFLSVNFATGGSVKGEGVYKSGDSVTVIATSSKGFKFEGWNENNLLISTDSTYKFVITANRFLVANFKNINGCDLPYKNIGFSVNSVALQKSFGPLDITCATNGAAIAFTIESVGNLEPTDFCKAYYKLDGGSQILIGEITGITPLKTFMVNSVTGKTIELFFDVKNSSADEFYHIKNIDISYVPTSAMRVSANEFVIYPNPASKTLTITFANNLYSKDIRLFDALGRAVYAVETANSKIEIDIKKLNINGWITVQMKSDNRVYSQKVLVQ